MGLLWLMAAFYVAAGLNHFVHPSFYLPMIPPSLPSPLGIVYVSGAAEVILGALVLLPSTRAIAAWGLVLLLIAVFPANVHIALYDVPLGGAKTGAGALNWIRPPSPPARAHRMGRLVHGQGREPRPGRQRGILTSGVTVRST